MSGQIPTIIDGAIVSDSKPRRGFDYIDRGISWVSYTVSYTAWGFVFIELLICGSWNTRTRFGVVATTASLAFVCYGYLLLRTNKYSLWWRIPLALVCFGVLPFVLYIWSKFPSYV